jgi:iron(III) transport system substrate-binding protein
MKRVLSLLLVMLLAIGLCAAALADGELYIVSPNSDGLLSIIPTFEAKTGIKVTVESLGSGDAMKRIASETANPTFDLMYGGSLANYAANKDLFQDYLSPEDGFLMPEYQNKLGYCTNYTIDGSVLLVNTELLAELGIEVNGYADLLQTELKDKIVSADPVASSSAFCQLTNMLLAMGGYESDEAWQYVADLFKNINGKVVSSSSSVYKGVYNGEYVVGLTYEDPCVTFLKDGAANIRIIYPIEGTVFLPAQIGIVNNAKNLANAQAFVDFMLSEEAQVFLAENTTSRPIRPVDAGNEWMTPLEDLFLIFEDSVYVMEHTGDLKEKVQDIIMDI